MHGEYLFPSFSFSSSSVFFTVCFVFPHFLFFSSWSFTVSFYGYAIFLRQNFPSRQDMYIYIYKYIYIFIYICIYIYIHIVYVYVRYINEGTSERRGCFAFSTKAKIFIESNFSWWIFTAAREGNWFPACVYDVVDAEEKISYFRRMRYVSPLFSVDSSSASLDRLVYRPLNIQIDT